MTKPSKRTFKAPAHLTQHRAEAIGICENAGIWTNLLGGMASDRVLGPKKTHRAGEASPKRKTVFLFCCMNSLAAHAQARC